MKPSTLSAIGVILAALGLVSLVAGLWNHDAGTIGVGILALVAGGGLGRLAERRTRQG